MSFAGHSVLAIRLFPLGNSNQLICIQPHKSPPASNHVGLLEHRLVRKLLQKFNPNFHSVYISFWDTHMVGKESLQNVWVKT